MTYREGFSSQLQPPRVVCVRTSQGISEQYLISAPVSRVMGMEVIWGKALKTVTHLSVLSPCPSRIKGESNE